jgi:quinol---cytochrome-c reductase cytochrome c subunit
MRFQRSPGGRPAEANGIGDRPARADAAGTGPAPAAPAAPPARPMRRSRLRRKVFAGLRLLAALTIIGGIYTGLAPGITHAEDTPVLSADGQKGKQLFETSCITCHGRNGAGVTDRGPSLIGVGAAAVEFQVSTGRMPLARQEAQAERKPPQFNAEQTRQLSAYIQELGGGPQLPEGERLRSSDPAALAMGGQLFRLNCSSCHAFGMHGGALSSGKFAPSLIPSTDRDIYAAMLSGPQNMPVFGDNELTPDEKRAIISYIQDVKTDRDPGGWGLARYGPVPEALVIFLVGMVAIVFATVWIAGKS